MGEGLPGESVGENKGYIARTDEFSRRLEEFRKNPLVDAFLNAELDFCRMIQEINGKIVEAVNFE